MRIWATNEQTNTVLLVAVWSALITIEKLQDSIGSLWPLTIFLKMFSYFVDFYYYYLIHLGFWLQCSSAAPGASIIPREGELPMGVCLDTWCISVFIFLWSAFRSIEIASAVSGFHFSTGKICEPISASLFLHPHNPLLPACYTKEGTLKRWTIEGSRWRLVNMPIVPLHPYVFLFSSQPVVKHALSISLDV